MNTICYCAEPDHDVCWGFEPNPDCECCQNTVESLDTGVPPCGDPRPDCPIHNGACD